MVQESVKKKIPSQRANRPQVTELTLNAIGIRQTEFSRFDLP